MRGRKPKPSVIRIIEGNKCRRPLPEGEPKPDAQIPDCPPHLDDEARAEWKRMAIELDSIGILTTIDKAIFASYCQAWSEWIGATMLIKQTGMLVKEGKYPKVNPLFRLVDAANARMTKALVEMGMTPSSRTRVKTAEKKEIENKKDRFFKSSK